MKLPMSCASLDALRRCAHASTFEGPNCEFPENSKPWFDRGSGPKCDRSTDYAVDQ